MKLALLSFVSAVAFAQTQPLASQPDCPPVALTFSGGNGIAPTLPTAYLDNRNTQCQTWTVAYEAAAGLSGYTVVFQSATGTDTPSSFTTYTGTMVASSASFGTAQYGIATFTSLSSTGGDSVNTPWLRLLVSGATGTGNMRVVFYGYRTGPTGGTGGGGGGGGGSGCTSPCPVVGTAAAGAPPSGDPVQIGGSDGTDIRTIATDSSGHPIAVGGAASGSVQVGNSIPAAGNDGTDVRTLKTDTSGDLFVSQIGRATFTSGQQAVTASAVNLGSNATTSVCVHAFIGNTINVYAGATGVTTSTGMEIPPGQGFCWTLANTNLVYVIASTTGASVSFTY
jgi:hypothetical protein